MRLWGTWLSRQPRNSQELEAEGELFAKGFSLGCLTVPALLIPPLIFWAIIDPDLTILGALFISLVIAGTTAVGVILIGTPVYLLLRTLRITHWSAYALAGFFSTGVLGFSFDLESLAFALCGLVTSLVFWWHAIRPNRTRQSITPDKQNAELQEPGAE